MDAESSSARQRLAAHLAGLRERANDGQPVTFRQLAERTHFGAATLNKAATGREVPTWPVVQAFVTECGGNPEDCRELWEQAKNETGPPATAPEAAPPAGPEQPGAGSATMPATRGRRVPRWLPWLAAAVVVVVVAIAAVVATSGPSATAPTPLAAPAGSPAASTTLPPPSPATSGPAGSGSPASGLAEIVSPAGPTVGFQFTVSGALSGQPVATVWEVTLEMDDTRFYPLNRPCVVLAGGQFTCGATFAGQETMAPGSEYTVLVVAADPDAVNAFHQYNALKNTPAGKTVHGMNALPPGAQIIGQKLVTRS